MFRLPTLSSPTYLKYLLLSFPAACLMPTVWGSVWEILLLGALLLRFPNPGMWSGLWRFSSVRAYSVLLGLIVLSACWQHNEHAWRGLEAYKHLLVFPIYGVLLLGTFRAPDQKTLAFMHTLLLLAAAAMLAYLYYRYLKSPNNRNAVGWMAFTRSTSLGVMLCVAAGVMLLCTQIKIGLRLVCLCLALFALLYILPSRTTVLCLSTLGAALAWRFWQENKSLKTRSGLLLIFLLLIGLATLSPNGIQRFTSIWKQEPNGSNTEY
ncbi:MAG: hypothetical protein RLZZ502_881, partial [Pseudomonadota bacterium]